MHSFYTFVQFRGVIGPKQLKRPNILPAPATIAHPLPEPCTGDDEESRRLAPDPVPTTVRRLCVARPATADRNTTSRRPFGRRKRVSSRVARPAEDETDETVPLLRRRSAQRTPVSSRQPRGVRVAPRYYRTVLGKTIRGAVHIIKCNATNRTRKTSA